MMSSTLPSALASILEARDNNEQSIRMLEAERSLIGSGPLGDLYTRAIADRERYNKIVALIAGIMDLPDRV